MKLPTSWPETIKSGNVTIRIYKVDTAKGYTEYKLAYYAPDGKRKFQSFADYADARKRADKVVGTLSGPDAHALTVSADDRLVYLRAVEALKPLGVPLDVAVAEYARARAVLGTVPIADAASYYARNCLGLRPVTVEEAVDELIASKETTSKRGVPASAKYIKDLRARLGRFAESFQMPLADITSREVELFVEKSQLKGRTRFNYLRILGTLFEYAKARRMYPKDVDPMEGIERGFVDAEEIEIFAPEELAKLLSASRPELVPFLAIGAFCGLRTAEIERLDWADVHADFIEIKAANSKTRSRRTVPIPANCAAWLRPHRQTTGPVVGFANIAKQVLKLAEDSETPWKHNALRHSFISYRLALTNDENRTAVEAGNSPQMIFRHYRKLVSEDAARRYFSIEPSEASNVLAMPAQGAA